MDSSVCLAATFYVGHYKMCYVYFAIVLKDTEGHCLQTFLIENTDAK